MTINKGAQQSIETREERKQISGNVATFLGGYLSRSESEALWILCEMIYDLYRHIEADTNTFPLAQLRTKLETYNLEIRFGKQGFKSILRDLDRANIVGIRRLKGIHKKIGRDPNGKEYTKEPVYTYYHFHNTPYIYKSDGTEVFITEDFFSLREQLRPIFDKKKPVQLEMRDGKIFLRKSVAPLYSFRKRGSRNPKILKALRVLQDNRERTKTALQVSELVDYADTKVLNRELRDIVSTLAEKLKLEPEDLLTYTPERGYRLRCNIDFSDDE